MADQHGNRQGQRLTDTEVAALDGEYKQLATQVETQTLEQQEFLRKEIQKDPNLNDAQRNRLCQVLDSKGFRLALFRITDANAVQQPHVQVTYDIDDELYDYLTRAESLLPKRLVGFLDGGTLLGLNKATAEDLAPMTGKTKTGVPMYDAMLAWRARGESS